MTTIKEVREALLDLERRQRKDTNIAAAMYTSGLIGRLDGMALVPVEPTEAMVSEGRAALAIGIGRYAGGESVYQRSMADAYRAMLNAAEDK